tara:strand:- start:285 stop:1289 length:1005 start_codon:yes stop_codon:yes gene_type:complete
MATYKDIAGTKVQNITGDPSDPIQGQIWYNETSNVLKGLVVNASGAWAAGPSINTGRGSGSGAGTKASGIIMAGYTPTLPSPESSSYTETWNGSSWTETTDSSTNRIGPAGAGADNEAAMVFGGTTGPGAGLSQVEVWNGSSWTEVNEVNTARDAMTNSGCGTITDAIYAGGRGPSTASEKWNGTSWTSTPSLNNGKTSPTTFGDSEGAINVLGATSTTVRNYCESWNGSAWTEVNEVNTGRSQGCGAGVQTLGIVNGGEGPGPSGGPLFNNTEAWNGTAWTNDLASPANRTSMMSTNQGTQTSFLHAGSGAPPFNPTLEWTGPGPSVVTFTSS